MDDHVQTLLAATMAEHRWIATFCESGCPHGPGRGFVTLVWDLQDLARGPLEHVDSRSAEVAFDEHARCIGVIGSPSGLPMPPEATTIVTTVISGVMVSTTWPTPSAHGPAGPLTSWCHREGTQVIAVTSALDDGALTVHRRYVRKAGHIWDGRLPEARTHG